MFEDIQAGDRVHRVLSGVVVMPLCVIDIDQHLIHCAGGWTFRRDTGGEVDEELGWDGIPTGSYLIRDADHGTLGTRTVEIIDRPVPMREGLRAPKSL